MTDQGTENGNFSFQTRKKIFYAIVIAVLLIMVGRLYQLQLLYQDELGKQSRENSVRTMIREPIRGLIFDRRGRLIVDNRPSYAITITPHEFRNDVIPELAELLNINEETLRQRIQRARSWSLFVPSKIHRDVDYEVIVKLEEFRERYPGVSYILESKRHYNSPARLSHVLGYTKEITERQLKRNPDIYRPGDLIGSAGIEETYEHMLRGERGFDYIMVNARGQFVADYAEGKKNIPSREGSDLFLTIDIELQRYAEELLNDRSGSIVAINPNSGEILALVSNPDYDLSNFSGVTPPDIWRSLNSDPAHPLFNRATSSIYPPGSTFKMVLAAAALEEGIINEWWTASCPGWYRFGNRTFRCHREEGHGRVNVVQAIQHSCNVFFYQLILEVGFERWAKYGKMFGFGKSTRVELLDEIPGILPDPNYYNRVYGVGQWTRGNLLSLAIGQGEVSVTPLQMAVYAMLIANNGKLFQPHLVSHVYDTRQKEVVELKFNTQHTEISDRTWNIIRRGMYRTVEEEGGTGWRARVSGKKSAGKTGTAQNPHGDGHAWYIGFAPYDNPQIAIAVVIENIGAGGTHAAPVAGKLIEKYLTEFNVQDPSRRVIQTKSPEEQTALPFYEQGND